MRSNILGPDFTHPLMFPRKIIHDFGNILLTEIKQCLCLEIHNVYVCVLPKCLRRWEKLGSNLMGAGIDTHVLATTSRLSAMFEMK